MIARKVGRCLTEYKVDNFDQEVAKYKQFLIVSQFDYLPKTVDDAKDRGLFTNTTDSAKLRTGCITLGVAEDGTLVNVGSIIDEGG